MSTWQAVSWPTDTVYYQVHDIFYFLTTWSTTPPHRFHTPMTSTPLYSSASASSQPMTSPAGTLTYSTDYVTDGFS